MEKRIILSAFISCIILMIWQYFFPSHVTQHDNYRSNSNEIAIQKQLDINQEEIQEEKIPLLVQSQYLKGSINLRGLKFDNLSLLKYKQSTNSSDVELLFDENEEGQSYLATLGWLSNDKSIELPNANTVWSSNVSKINEETKEAELSWVNNNGIKFIVNISLDSQYLFTIKTLVENKSGRNINLSNYATINRSKGDEINDNFILHEGVIGVTENKLNEISFGDLEKDKKVKFHANKGWFGFSDKYWLTAFISSEPFDCKIISYQSKNSKQRRFQVDLISNSYAINSNSINGTANYHFFAGAKRLELLDNYEKEYDIPLFDHAVDFGILYFITKPLFLLLNYLYGFTGNFGFAIMLLTVLVKLALFPLAHKGFRSMNKLKSLQPQLDKIKAKCKDNPALFQKSIMELYKKEKVSPVSGCLPIILQMPIFFALYKVLYVTIEMRHAPFIWWINDLSAPDPTNLFTLFGLVPWQVPSFLTIGVLPIMMALTVFLQQQFNPQPSDPVQAKVMKMLPLIFLFIFASFPAGLLLYWTWSNILSIIQQFVISKIEK